MSFMHRFRKSLLAKPRYERFETSVSTVLLKPFFFARRFTFRDEHYPYVIHRYNATYSNERMVEIALARKLLRRFNGKRVLEIGNVLCHYGATGHEVLDKFEEDPHVTHQIDVCDFKPKQPYDLVISISTMEHVGFDERSERREPRKVIEAIRSIRTFTRGTFIFTFPIGFNHGLDNFVFDGTLEREGLTISFLKRTSFLTWHEIDTKSIKPGKHPHDHSILVIAEYSASEKKRPVKQ